MTKKQHLKGFTKVMHTWIKPALKATTHVFTVSGVVVAASPLATGLHTAAAGDFKSAGEQLLYSATGSVGGSSVTATQAAKTAVVNVGIPVLVGIGLVWAGGQLRKRIGN